MEEQVTERKPRDPEEVQKEYVAIAQQLGDKVYREDVIKLDIELLKRRMFELNKEFHDASKPTIETKKAGDSVQQP